jgi:hypothetical protein
MKKKLIAISLTLIFIGVSSNALANTPGTTTVGQTPTSVTPTLPSSMIDNIEVPFDVLNYIQTEHQGYAATQVSKISRDGKQLYRLRVDRDSVPDDYDSIYLLYDMEWKLLGEEKMMAPPPPVQVLPQSQTSVPLTESRQPQNPNQNPSTDNVGGENPPDENPQEEEQGGGGEDSGGGSGDGEENPPADPEPPVNE